MKKISIVILTFILLIGSALILFVSSMIVQNKILYQNYTELSLTVSNSDKKDRSNSDKINILYDMSEKYNITISKYVYSNQKKLNVYTTEPSLNRQIILKKGHFPGRDTKQFAIDQQSKNNTTKISGQFSYVGFDNHLIIYPLSALETAGGIEGTIYISQLSHQNLENLSLDLFEKLGLNTTLKESDRGLKKLLTNVSSNYLLVLAVLILVISTVFTTSFYVIKNSKKTIIYQVNGFSKNKIIYKLSFPLIMSIFVVALLGILTAILLFNFYIGSFLPLKTYLILYTIYVIGISVGVLVIVSINLWTLTKRNNINNFIKGYQPVKPLIFMSFFFKTLFIILLPIVLLSISKIETKIRLEQASTNEWNKTQNVYQIQVSYITHDYDVYRPYEKKIKNFYNNSTTAKLFLIDTSNFSTMSDGHYTYQNNTSSTDEQLYSHLGKSITINYNYLAQNPINKQNTKKISEKDIIYDTHTLNLLVPEKLKHLEDKIINSYKEYFNFYTYEIPKNIYNETIFNSVDSTINIIYTQNKQNYFTFNQDVSLNNKNMIIDPIAIVDTGNLDPSQYAVWATSSLFFQYQDRGDGYSFLEPHLQKNEIKNVIQSVFPIYDHRAQYINDLQVEAIYLQLLFLFSIVSVLICLYCFTTSFFEKNKKEFAIKRTLGYSYFTILKQLFFVTVMWDSSIFILACSILAPSILVKGTVSLTLFEIGYLLLIGLFKTKNMTTFLIRGD